MVKKRRESNSTSYGGDVLTLLLFFLEEIDDEHAGDGTAQVFWGVGYAAVKEDGVARIKDDFFLVELVFDLAVKDIFVFEGLGFHQGAEGVGLQFEDNDIDRGRVDQLGEYPLVVKAHRMLFFEAFVFVFTFHEHRGVGGFGLDILKEFVHVDLQGFDDLYEHQERRNGAAVFDL